MLNTIKIQILLPEGFILFFLLSVIIIWCFILLQSKKSTNYNYVTVFAETLVSTLPVFYFFLGVLVLFFNSTQNWHSALNHNLFI